MRSGKTSVHKSNTIELNGDYSYKRVLCMYFFFFLYFGKVKAN